MVSQKAILVELDRRIYAMMPAATQYRCPSCRLTVSTHHKGDTRLLCTDCQQLFERIRPAGPGAYFDFIDLGRATPQPLAIAR